MRCSDGFCIVLASAAFGRGIFGFSSGCGLDELHHARGSLHLFEPISVCFERPSRLRGSNESQRGASDVAHGSHYYRLNLFACGRATELNETGGRGCWSPACAVLDLFYELEQSAGSRRGRHEQIFLSAYGAIALRFDGAHWHHGHAQMGLCRRGRPRERAPRPMPCSYSAGSGRLEMAFLISLRRYGSPVARYIGIS